MIEDKRKLLAKLHGKKVIAISEMDFDEKNQIYSLDGCFGIHKSKWDALEDDFAGISDDVYIIVRDEVSE